MKSLLETIKEAEAKKIAIGHFNISDLVALKAITEVAREFAIPIVVGISEGERDFVGLKEAVALVRVARESGVEIFLNADHTYSFEKVKEAIDAGCDSVVVDGAKFPMAENIKLTRQCVEYAKSKNSNVIVEGELGYIGTSSKLLDELPSGASVTANLMTKPEDAETFVKETGVDLLAPAVGTVHGMLRHAKQPALDIERIRMIREKAAVPLVLHGGSGTTDEDFVSAIDAGVSMIHINTELRVAWRKGVEDSLKATPEEITPYKLLSPALQAVKEAVRKRAMLFSKIG